MLSTTAPTPLPIWTYYPIIEPLIKNIKVQIILTGRKYRMAELDIVEQLSSEVWIPRLNKIRPPPKQRKRYREETKITWNCTCTDCGKAPNIGVCRQSPCKHLKSGPPPLAE